jgi:hypothetical protein
VQYLALEGMAVLMLDVLVMAVNRTLLCFSLYRFVLNAGPSWKRERKIVRILMQDVRKPTLLGYRKIWQNPKVKM